MSISPVQSIPQSSFVFKVTEDTDFIAEAIPTAPIDMSQSLQLQVGIDKQHKQTYEEKEKAILAITNANTKKFKSYEKKSKADERLQQEVARYKQDAEKLKNKLILKKHETVQLESELAVEHGRRIHAERETLLYRQAAVQPVAVAEPDEAVPFCQSIRNGFNTAGSFCRRHDNLFVAGIGITGAALAIVFIPQAPGIVLATGAAIALFKWVISFF